MKKRKGLTRRTSVSAHITPHAEETLLDGGDLGWAYQDGTGHIEIDPRQNSKEYLDTLIHEMLHIFFPKLNEKTTCLLAQKMTKIIWNKRYRRIYK